MKFNNDELIIYTVLIGSNAVLNKQPFFKYSKYRHVCVTDNQNLTSNDWEIIYTSPMFPKDSSRSQRNLKLRPHLIFPQYKYSFYFDNTVVLEVKTEDIIAYILSEQKIKKKDPFFIAPFHSYRKDLLSEFKICAKYKLANQLRIYEQLDHYIKTDLKSFREKPYWAGILFRNHNHPKIMNHGEIWFSHLCRYTRRDQLSLIHSANQSKIKINGFNLDNKKSPFHKWPIELERRNRKYHDDFLDILPSDFSKKISIRFEKYHNLIYKLKINKKDLNMRIQLIIFFKFVFFRLKFLLRSFLVFILNFL